MVQITGKYQTVSTEKMAEHLKAIGVPEEHAKVGESLNSTTEFKQDGNKITTVFTSGEHVMTNTYTLGEEKVEKLPIGIEVTTVAKLEGDTLVINSKTKDGKTGTRTYKFSDNGEMVTTLVSNQTDIVAKRVCKKV